MPKSFSFILFFVFVVLQGALRKWYFPSLGTPLYLFQYALLYYFYFTMQGRRSDSQSKFVPAFQGLLTIYVVYGFLEMLNTSGTDNYIVQVYGFLMHFSFVPLVYYMSKVMVDEETLQKHLTWMAYLLIPVFFLGISQYFSSKDAFINRYATDQEDGTYEVVVTGSDKRVRIAGTFSYLATYASFLCFILHLLFYGTIISLIKRKLNWYFAVAYGMGIMNIFMTASRGPTVYYGVSEAITLLVLVSSGQAKFLKNLIPLGLMFVIGYYTLQSTEAGSASIGSFFDRFNGLNDIDGRLDDTFAPFKHAEMCGPVGYGVGTAQFPMAQYLTYRWQMPAYWEEEGERIVIELGVIGYFLVMALRWMVAYSCYRIFKRIRKLEYKILAVQMTAFQLPFLLNLQTNIFNYIDGIFYWMAVGLVYFAYVMDKKYKAKMDAQALQEDSILPQQ